MRLHIFNPEHDLALAINRSSYVPPHVARRLRADLGFLPCLWASDGDIVLVDDVESALEQVRHIKKYAHDVIFISDENLACLGKDITDDISVEPWGWDKAIRARLKRACPRMTDRLPNDEQLDELRQLSSRQWAAEHLLPRLLSIDKRLVGFSRYVVSVDDINTPCVLKSPWSSSGRGVRHVDKLDSQTVAWIKNVIKQQGGIMMERKYNKVKDFGMEFHAVDGETTYCGLSLFDTSGTAYTGNLLASEKLKRKLISRYVDLNLLDKIRDEIIETVPLQEGFFGVDMMIVGTEDSDGYRIHPCVEMNVRMTMGHVALAMSPTVYEPRKMMRIALTDKFRLRIIPMMDDLLNTSLVSY